MDSGHLGEPLFVRTYHHGDGRALEVRIWKPDDSSGITMCWFQIGDGTLHRAPGMDSLDALLRAMQAVEMFLSDIRKKDAGLHWQDAMHDGDLGLPQFYPDTRA